MRRKAIETAFAVLGQLTVQRYVNEVLVLREGESDPDTSHGSRAATEPLDFEGLPRPYSCGLCAASRLEW
jgi:hypothetical protein